MTNTNATAFRKHLFTMLEQTIRYNEPVNISTKEGNAVLLSEEDYNGLIETLRVLSDPLLCEKVIEGRNTPFEECLSLDEVGL